MAYPLVWIIHYILDRLRFFGTAHETPVPWGTPLTLTTETDPDSINFSHRVWTTKYMKEILSAYSPLLGPMIIILIINLIWFLLWRYFERTYPQLRKKYFPHGSASYIPPSEFYRRDTWKALHTEVWADIYIRIGVMGIALGVVLFIVAGPFLMILQKT